MVLWGGGNPSGLILVFSSRENLQTDLCERVSTADEFDAMWKAVLTWGVLTLQHYLTLCQLDKCCIALLLSDSTQISFPFGRDTREPRASSMAISSLRKTEQPSGFLLWILYPNWKMKVLKCQILR
ncbi:hypothetical protein TNCV_1661651 [Trichonephila clavipes]|nr:hypothetical protein TNCV_1661651 [Trichonephila clavipes]